VARLSPAKRKLARTKRLNSKLFRQIDAVNQIAVHHFKRAQDLEAQRDRTLQPLSDQTTVINGGDAPAQES
jgi:hypothetical protein